MAAIIDAVPFIRCNDLVEKNETGTNNALFIKNVEFVSLLLPFFTMTAVTFNGRQKC